MPNFNFDNLETIEFPVKLKGQWYICREANGRSGTNYRNGVFAAVRAAKGGENIHVQGMADPQPRLVSDCMWHAEVVEGPHGKEYPWDGDPAGYVRLEMGNQLTEAEVGEFPSRVMHKLFKELQKISELTEFEGDLATLRKNRDKLNQKISTIEAAEQAAKNDPQPTGDG
jgi:hypothetical protein